MNQRRALTPKRNASPGALRPAVGDTGAAHADLPPSGIQRYFLYGHQERAFEHRFMHCERIEEQLSQHDWDAKPHVHDGLHQILYFEQGHGQLLVEDDWQDFTAPVLLFVPQGTVHGFHFSRDTTGFVLTLAHDFMDDVLAGVDREVQGVVVQPRVHFLAPAQSQQLGLGAILRLIETDYQHGGVGRTTALVSGLSLMLVRLAQLLSHQSEVRASGSAPYQAYFRQFQELVEAGFRSQPSVSAMAEQLNLTEGRLTAICRAVASASPQQILHARLLVEAKRLLLYTARPSSSIAYTLGFKDPGYFSRFFKRATGQTPKAFRHPGRSGTAA